MYFVEKVRNKYKINEDEDISVLFEEQIENFFLPAIVKRVKEYLKGLE